MGMSPRRNSPPKGSRASAAISTSVSTSESTCFAWATNRSPTGVTITCRWVRSTSVTPRDSSSFFSRVESVGWLTKHACCRTTEVAVLGDGNEISQIPKVQGSTRIFA